MRSLKLENATACRKRVSQRNFNHLKRTSTSYLEPYKTKYYDT